MQQEYGEELDWKKVDINTFGLLRQKLNIL